MLTKRRLDMASTVATTSDHHQLLDTFTSTKILMVVANPSVNPKLGWPLGFWASELMHPYFELPRPDST